MTINGWTQIAIFALLVAALTKPLGGYMTRVFNGDRTISAAGATANRDRPLPSLWR